MFLRVSLALALALLAQNPAPQGVRVSGRVVGLPPGTLRHDAGEYGTTGRRHGPLQPY